MNFPKNNFDQTLIIKHLLFCHYVQEIKFGIQEEPSLSFLDTKFCLLHIKNAKIECLQVNV